MIRYTETSEFLCLCEDAEVIDYEVLASIAKELKGRNFELKYIKRRAWSSRIMYKIKKTK